MANPKVRPHLSFYPEDTGVKRSEARQSDRWLHEVADDELTPMARIGVSGRYQDFYVHEPAMLRDGTVCVPVRWFAVGHVLFAKCWRMQTISTDYGDGWRVLEYDDYSVPLTEFLKTFPELWDDAEAIYGLPHPSKIIGVFYLYLAGTSLFKPDGRHT